MRALETAVFKSGSWECTIPDKRPARYTSPCPSRSRDGNDLEAGWQWRRRQRTPAPANSILQSNARRAEIHALRQPARLRSSRPPWRADGPIDARSPRQGSKPDRYWGAPAPPGTRRDNRLGRPLTPSRRGERGSRRPGVVWRLESPLSLPRRWMPALRRPRGSSELRRCNRHRNGFLRGMCWPGRRPIQRAQPTRQPPTKALDS